jgi:hypothetical protein
MGGAVDLHSPNTPSWRGAQGEHRDNFTFYLYVLWIIRVQFVEAKPKFLRNTSPEKADSNADN